MKSLIKFIIIGIIIALASGTVVYTTLVKSEQTEEETTSPTSYNTTRESMTYKDRRIVDNTENLNNYSKLDSDKYIVVLVDDKGQEYNIGSSILYNAFASNKLDKTDIQCDVFSTVTLNKSSSRIVSVHNVELTGYNE